MFNKTIKLSLLTAALLLGQSANADKPLLAVGYYITDEWLPLILSSPDDGINWSVVPKTAISAPQKAELLLGGISCTSQACFSAGSFRTKDHQYPLLMTSPDEGQTWNKVKLPIPKTMYAGLFWDMNCYGDHCVLNGDVYYPKNYSIPLLVTSLDGGKHWYYSSIFTNFPNPYSGQNLVDSTCTSGFCATVGSYSISKGKYGYSGPWPLILTSNANLNRWTFALKITNLSPKQETYPEQVKCTDKTCIVVGSLFTYRGIYMYEQPALITGGIGKQGWSFVTNEIQNLPSDLDAGSLDTLNCYGEFCMITGNWYDKENNHGHPLTVISQDGGLTWTAQPTPTTTPKSNYNFVYDSFCDESVCLEPGKYMVSSTVPTFDGPWQPFIIRSTDKGQTWVPTVIKNIPSKLMDAYLFAITCHSDTCVAAGMYYSYVSENKDESYPWWVVSTDHGLTWDVKTYQDIIGMSGLKSGMIMGFDSNGSSSSSSKSYLGGNTQMMKNAAMTQHSIKLGYPSPYQPISA